MHKPSRLKLDLALVRTLIDEMERGSGRRNRHSHAARRRAFSAGRDASATRSSAEVGRKAARRGLR